MVDYAKTEINKDYEIAKNRLDKEFETKIKRESLMKIDRSEGKCLHSKCNQG